MLGSVEEKGRQTKRKGEEKREKKGKKIQKRKVYLVSLSFIFLKACITDVKRGEGKNSRRMTPIHYSSRQVHVCFLQLESEISIHI